MIVVVGKEVLVEKARMTGSNRYPLFRSNHVFRIGSVNAPVSDMGGWERVMNGEEGDVERKRTDICSSAYLFMNYLAYVGYGEERVYAGELRERWVR
jgi:hypothetical protein